MVCNKYIFYTEPFTKTLSASKPSITTLTSKATTVSSLATMKLGNMTSSGVGSITVVLTHSGPKTKDQLEINQLIDFLMDNKILYYCNVVHLCLLPLPQKVIMLKQLAEYTKTLKGV